MHLVGAGDNPILILKKKDVPKLFSTQFWYIFELWQAFHNRIDIGLSLQNSDPELINILTALESHYEMNFSTRIVMIQYTEVIIKRMDAIMKRLDVYLGKRKRR